MIDSVVPLSIKLLIGTLFSVHGISYHFQSKNSLIFLASYIGLIAADCHQYVNAEIFVRHHTDRIDILCHTIVLCGHIETIATHHVDG